MNTNNFTFKNFCESPFGGETSGQSGYYQGCITPEILESE